MTTPLGNSGNSLAPKGLEDVIANQSAVCLVDGTRGRLLYRGYDIHDLAAHSTFEETEYLLMVGALPTRTELREFVGQIKSAQKLDKVTTRVIKDAAPESRPMNVLCTAVSASVYTDPDKADSKAGELRKSVRLLAKIPTIIAASARKEIRGAAMV